ncbi:MAG TPA: hypothetical protein VKV77_07880 [Methylovirgula sp.]|nr:hypothetical protein [Methylovirgula sp.]
MFRLVLSSVAALALAAAASAVQAQDLGDFSPRVAQACAHMGLNPSEATFLFCEMSLQESAGAAPGAPGRVPAHHHAAMGANGSLGAFYPRRDQAASVRRACAEVGLVPGTSVFESCAGNLNLTIDNADMVGSD